MIVDVRGGCGVQVIELLVACARVLERGKTITGVRAHVGVSQYWQAGYDYVSLLFPRLEAFRVERVRDAGKHGVFTRKNTAADLECALRRRERVLAVVGIPPRTHTAPRVLHQRTGNRCPVGQDAYERVLAGGRYRVVGNAATDELHGQGVDVRALTAVDWLLCYSADELVTADTAFTLSSLFVRPDHRVRLWRGDHLTPYLEELAPRWFPNLEFL